MAVVMPPPVLASDLAFIRSKTNGAAGWTDDALAELAQQWLTSQEAMDEGAGQHGEREEPEESPDVEASEQTVVLDLWAAAAMVLEQRLIAALDDPTAGTVQARSGDAHLQYASTGGSTWLLRTLIKRYWRLADPANRARVHPSGWRTVQPAVARRLRLNLSLAASVVINGPGVGVEATDWP